MAKANEADLNMAMELSNALDALTNRWSPAMPESASTNCDDEEQEHFNIDNNDQCKRALEYLLSLADRASLMRVVWGCAVMLDPANELVDPNADTIEHHPKRQMIEQQRDELLAYLKLALTGIECAIETAQKYEDETFIAHVLTADKLRFIIEKAES